MKIIGIDPGITGAIAILNENLECEGCNDMPVMQLGANHQQVNSAELAKILDYWRKKEATVYLEQVTSMPGQGVTSMFNFGMSYGMVQGVCAALGIPVRLIRPNKWKKMAGLIGKAKDEARTLAIQLYPTVSLERKKDIGRADALLIGRFGHLADMIG